MQDGEKVFIPCIVYSLPDPYAFSVHTLALDRKWLCDKLCTVGIRFPLNFV
jgi:hypothetical protein